MAIRFRALLLSVVVWPVMAQQSATGGAQQSAKAPVATQKAEGLTVDGVIALVGAGLPDDVIIARLRKENKSFDLTTEQLIRLKNANVSGGVMQVMLDPKAEIKPAVAPSTPAPAQPVVVSVPGLPIISSVRSAGASGATPAPGTEAKGDPNDPTSSHDSGIYLMTKDHDGKAQMVILERASYQGSKSGGYLASAMTYGIVKAKTKAAISGPHANIRVAETSPVFYFYFDDKQAGLGKTYFGVGNLSNPNQFSLLKLEVTKQGRESTVGQFSALGSSSGTDAKATIPFKSERIRPGLYKVTVEGLKSGEYCFVASSNMGIQSPYGATANVTTDIFDFGANIE
jgi:hypothetical protein